ncbi:MAG: 3'-5' exonuclease [Candidatus Dormibacteria bacterium]
MADPQPGHDMFHTDSSDANHGPVRALISRLGSDERTIPVVSHQWESPSPRTPSLNTLLTDLYAVAVDCETQGHAPAQLIEIGALGMYRNAPVARLETLVHSTAHINPFAARIHHISRGMLHDAPHVHQVIDLLRSLAAHGVTVEHSPDAFDSRLIAQVAGAPITTYTIDTSRLAQRIWELPQTISLENLCIRLGVSNRGAHFAYGDAEATAACFTRLLDLGRDQFGWQTLRDLEPIDVSAYIVHVAEEKARKEERHRQYRARHYHKEP